MEEKQSFVKEMQSKHLITLSLGGVIGTGIFLSSGYLIQEAGAVGTIIAYLIGAFLVCLVMLCLGELTVHDPNTGAFHTYASKYIHPGVGFVVAWLYWLTWTVALGYQFITLAIFMGRWFPGVDQWIWCLIFALFILGLNIFNLKLFANSEFWMSFIKVIALAVILVLGLLATFGILKYQGASEAPMFKEFTKNGVFPNGFGAIALAILSANFAFSGAEIIGVAAGETKNPEKSVPKAIFQTLVILIVLFIGTIVVIGALLPQEKAGLDESPFVTILTNIGIPYIGDIMNFILIVTLLSAANSGLYAASRMLWSLSNQNTLPKSFSKLNKKGLPVYGLALTMLGGFLSLFSSIYAAETVYLVLTSISGLAVVGVWLGIGWSHYNFRKQYIQNGGLISDLKYKAPLYPVVPILVIILCLVSMVGIAIDPNQRIGLIIFIPFVILCFGYYQLVFKNKK